MKFTDNPRYKENIILMQTFEFAVEAVKYAEQLESMGKKVISSQVLRSGTSIGGNVKEAQNAESKKDFIHKIKIAQKEADEVEYWLYLCNELDSYPSSEGLLEKLESIKKILNKIGTTSRVTNQLPKN